MYQKIVAIGPLINTKTSYVGGQFMMFELFIDALHKNHIPVNTIDIGGVFFKKIPRKPERLSFLRVLDYLVIISKAFLTFLANPKQYLYLTTAQSKMGFLRDFILVKIASVFKYRIVCHQFGANYKNFFDQQSHRIQLMIKNTFAKAEIIIVEGEYVKNQFSFLHDYKKKVISIPNGIPERNLQINGKEKSYNNELPFQLIYLSNMIVSKGYLDVLKAVKILICEYKLNVECIFAGPFLNAADDINTKTVENLKKDFFGYIEDNQLKSYIKYFPSLFGNDKAEAFKNANVFLLPSYYVNEGQPVSILEAIAYGSVPIVTNYRLISLMVNENSGYFVPPKCPKKIAETICFLMKNPEAYSKSSAASIALYQDQFTADKYTNKLLKLFEINS